MIRVAVLALVVTFTPVIGEATVYEYGRDGQVIVRQYPGLYAVRQTASGPGTTGASRAIYRDMAEQVALRHAGGDGPRKAGLDAITFMRLFVELIPGRKRFSSRTPSPRRGRKAWGS